MRAIFNEPCCNNHIERHTMRIRGQMYLGADSPFCASHMPVAAMCAGGGGLALIRLASIINHSKSGSVKNFTPSFPNSSITPLAKNGVEYFSSLHSPAVHLVPEHRPDHLPDVEGAVPAVPKPHQICRDCEGLLV